MKKKISFKLFVTVLWRGICQVIQPIAKLFGYKEEGTLSRIIWRTFATCLTLVLLVFTVALVYTVANEVYREWIRPNTSECVYDTNHLSNHLVYQNFYYRDKGRIYDEARDKVVMDDVDWVVVSDDMDSLAVFSKNNKRGYLDRFSGEVVLPAVYSKAWVFSEGLAAVEKDNRLVFINRHGEIVIDNGLEVYWDEASYTFHGGYCIVESPVDGKSGLIDRQGNWSLQPEYDEIHHVKGLWRVMKDGMYGLFSEKLDTMFAVEYPNIRIWENFMEVRFPDHTARQFDLKGNILVDFVIDEVVDIYYETTEQRYNEAGEYMGEVMAVAKCQRYEVRGYDNDEYYGLIARNGKRITPPEYKSIEAIAEDLYLCKPQGIILNGKGERVK